MRVPPSRRCGRPPPPRRRRSRGRDAQVLAHATGEERSGGVGCIGLRVRLVGNRPAGQGAATVTAILACTGSQGSFQTGILDVKIETLADEDAVCEAEVDGNGDNDGDEMCPEGAYEVCNVTDEPDEEESDGDRIR